MKNVKAMVGKTFIRGGVSYTAKSVVKFHGNKLLVLQQGSETVYADPSRMKANGWEESKAPAKAKKAKKTSLSIEDKWSSEGLRAIAHAFADHGQRFFATSGQLKADASGVTYAKTGKVYQLVDTDRLEGGIIQVTVTLNGHEGLIYSDPALHESFMTWCC